MSFGDYLRNAREQRDVTLDELWRRTKVRRHLLLELEEDDLSRWPKYLVYRHGYIRSIADALELDRDELLDYFDEAFPEYEPVAFDNSKRRLRPRRHAPAAARLMTPGAATLAVASGLVVGLVLSIPMSRRSASPRVAESDLALNHGSTDIRLDSEADDPASSAPSPDPEPVQVVAAHPRNIEGEVRVLSDPPDAIVAVNGVGRGRTPATIRFLPLGSHTIRVVQFGYKARELRVTLTPDQPVRRVRVALRPRDDQRSALQ